MMVSRFFLRGDRNIFIRGKKTFLYGLLISGMMACLTGCHGRKSLEPFEVPETFDTSKQYTVTFWAKNDTNKAQTKVYEDAIKDFEELYPNIHVNMRLYTNYGTIYNDVITNISTGTTPDVCITYPDHIATYLTGSNVVVPLEELFENKKYGLGGSELRFDGVKKEELIPQFLQECRIGEKQYAIPFMRSTECCYINKTYVEKLGYTIPNVLTWDFVFEVSEKAMEQKDDGTFLVNDQNVLIPFIYKSTDNMMIQMLKQKNAGYSKADGTIEIFNDTTKELLTEIAQHGKSRAFSTFKISSYPANFLNAGQCLFAVDSSAGATWMGTDAPLSDISADKLRQFETVVKPVPQFDPTHIQMISQGPSVCIFNKEDPNQVLASWIFAQYLLTNEVQVAYSQTEGYIPVTTKARESEAYQKYLSAEGIDNKEHYAVKIQAAKLLIDHTEDTFVTPVFNGSASLRDAAGQLIENVVKSVRRNEIVDAAYIEKQFQDVSSLYRLNQNRGGEMEKQDLGPLPGTAKVLLGVLVLAWVGIVIYVVLDKRRSRP